MTIFRLCENSCSASASRRVRSFVRLRSESRAGAATIEFAVVAPVFFLVVLGIVEIGRGVMVQHLLLNAARQGCRTGILPSNGNAQVATAVANTLAPAGIASQSISVTVNDKAADTLTASTGDDISVSVTVPIRSVTWLPGNQYLFGNISAQYTLRKQ